MIVDHPMRRALLTAAACLLTATVLAALRQRHVVSPETVMRLMGVLFGAVALGAANAIPKKLVPLARLSGDPAREQALRRFSGWTLVLGGLGYMLAYAFAPIAFASTLGIGLLASTLVLVVGVRAYCAWPRGT